VNTVMYLVGHLDRGWQVVGHIQGHRKWVTPGGVLYNTPPGNIHIAQHLQT